MKLIQRPLLLKYRTWFHFSGARAREMKRTGGFVV